jgi:hypothetical protein
VPFHCHTAKVRQPVFGPAGQMSFNPGW